MCVLGCACVNATAHGTQSLRVSARARARAHARERESDANADAPMPRFVVPRLCCVAAEMWMCGLACAGGCLFMRRCSFVCHCAHGMQGLRASARARAPVRARACARARARGGLGSPPAPGSCGADCDCVAELSDSRLFSGRFQRDGCQIKSSLRATYRSAVRALLIAGQDK